MLHQNVGDRILSGKPFLIDDRAVVNIAIKDRSTCDKTFLKPHVRSWQSPKYVFNCETVLSTEDRFL